MADVPVVSKTGSIGVIDDTELQRALSPLEGYRLATPEEVDAEKRKREYGGIGGAAVTALSSAALASGGAPGILLQEAIGPTGRYIVPELSESLRSELLQYREANPMAAMYGDIAPAVVAGAATGGVTLAGAGVSAGRAALFGAVEGGLQAAQSQVTESSLHNQALKGEQLLTAVGVGAALGGVFGAGGQSVDNWLAKRLTKTIAAPSADGIEKTLAGVAGPTGDSEVAKWAAKNHARISGVLSGQDPALVEKYSQFLRVGRQNFADADGAKKSLESLTPELAKDLEDILVVGDTIRHELGATTKLGHIQKTVARDRLDVQSTAARAHFLEGEEMFKLLDTGGFGADDAFVAEARRLKVEVDKAAGELLAAQAVLKEAEVAAQRVRSLGRYELPEQLPFREEVYRAAEVRFDAKIGSDAFVRSSKEAYDAASKRLKDLDPAAREAAKKARGVQFGATKEWRRLRKWAQSTDHQVEAAIARGDAAEVASLLDNMKREVDSRFMKPIKIKGAAKVDQSFLDTAEKINDWNNRLRSMLASKEVWGEFGDFQLKMNRHVHGYLDAPVAGLVQRGFQLKTTPGMTDSANLYSSYSKILSKLQKIDTPHNKPEWDAMRKSFEERASASEVALEYLDLPADKRAILEGARDKATVFVKRLDEAARVNKMARELAELEKPGGLGTVLSPHALGTLTGVSAFAGGPAGAAAGVVAGAAVSSLLHPGAFIRHMAAIHKFTGEIDTSVARKVGGLFADAAKRVPRIPVRGAATKLTVREQARSDYERKSKDVRATTPDVVTQRTQRAFGPLGAAAPNTVKAARDAALRAHSFLLSKLPATLPSAMGRDQTPSYEEIRKFLKSARAVEDPSSVIDDIANGHLSREAIESVKVVYPKFFEDMKDKVTKSLIDMRAKGKDLPYRQRVQLGLLLESTTDPTLDPGFMKAVASSYSAVQESPTGPHKGGGTKAPKLSDAMKSGSEETSEGE